MIPCYLVTLEPCYFEQISLLAFVVAAFQMGEEVKVLVPLPDPDAALSIETGSPLCSTADAYGTL
ncbi:MAG: hypothetical protein IKI83_03270, partial [Prevotella sp.]|nr:hypothetical protein [Prevotella sp.]